MFLALYILRLKHRRQSKEEQDWFKNRNIKPGTLTGTLMWIAFMLTLSVFCFAAVILSPWGPLPKAVSLSLGIAALSSVAEVGALASSTIYTLQGGRFIIHIVGYTTVYWSLGNAVAPHLIVVKPKRHAPAPEPSAAVRGA